MTYGTQLELEGLLLDIWYSANLKVTHVTAWTGPHTAVDMKLEDFSEHMQGRIREAVEDDYASRDDAFDTDGDAYHDFQGSIA